MEEKAKGKPAHYTIDFVTALSKSDCIDRLDRPVILPARSLGAWLAPMTQQVFVRDSGQFIVERGFPGALHPIRLEGNLEDHEDGGTWVNGAITRDTYNQVLVEGLIVFVAFFVITALLFLRLMTRGLVITLPMLLAVLLVLSIRWRALRAQTLDLTRWLRRRLYVTTDQIR